MKDDSHNGDMAPPIMVDAEVRRLAQRAIAALSVQGPARSDGMGHRLDRLVEAFISPDEDTHHDLLLKMRQDGVSVSDIIDHVLPAAARLMGERWADDTLSFADVSIGAARLQEAVRALSARERTRVAATAPEILLLIPRPEHHTLGAFVLADQWRRMGFRVDVQMDLHPRQLADLLQRRRYAMIGITAAGRRTLASASELVDIIRRTCMRATPVVIGGPVLEKGADVCAVTGADHAARDAADALRACGLLAGRHKAPSFEMTGAVGTLNDRR